MDTIARERWEAKLSQHRAFRAKEYSFTHSLASLTEKILDLNGKLLHDWISFFHASWSRERTVTPELLTAQEKTRIAHIIKDEQERIHKEIENWITQNSTITDKTRALANFTMQLNSSCDVLQTKCFEEIENDHAIRIEELKKDRALARERWQERGMQLGIGALVAIISAWSTNWFNKGEIDPIKAELSMLRSEYHQLVSWVVMSPAQIDSEISYLKSDLTKKKYEISSRYSEKRKALANDLATKGVLTSLVAKMSQDKLNTEEQQEIENVTRDIQRKIQVLLEKKESK